MSVLAVERSTAKPSFAWRGDDGEIVARECSADRGGGWAVELRDFIAGCAGSARGPRRILVGTGPGSFAGVRAALAFAQGYAAMRPDVEVAGLVSPCACAAAVPRAGDAPLAVVGDARRGLLWVARFAGLRLEAPVAALPAAELAGAVPAGAAVCSPDDARIGGLLREQFGARYLGEAVPAARGLLAAADANAGWIAREPLPAYLSPAVR